VTGYNPSRHNRQSIRIKGYDYTRPGAYFVTVVTHERAPVFGDAVFRRVAETMWQRIPRHFPHVELDAWVVMPNHMHGIIVIVDEPPGRGEAFPESNSLEKGDAYGVGPSVTDRPFRNASPLPERIRAALHRVRWARAWGISNR
jgi:hypothetical protein